MFCWPWKHEWKFVDIESRDWNFDSLFLYYCTKCGKFKSIKVCGSWAIKHKYEIEDSDGEKIIHLHERN